MLKHIQTPEKGVQFDTRQKSKLSHYILNELMGEKITKNGTTRNKQGLVEKMVDILEKDIDSLDDEKKYKAVDRILKLTQMIMPKAPSTNVNLLNMGGKTKVITSKTVQSIDDFLTHRKKEITLRENQVIDVKATLSQDLQKEKDE